MGVCRCVSLFVFFIFSFFTVSNCFLHYKVFLILIISEAILLKITILSNNINNKINTNKIINKLNYFNF